MEFCWGTRGWIGMIKKVDLPVGCIHNVTTEAACMHRRSVAGNLKAG